MLGAPFPATSPTFHCTAAPIAFQPPFTFHPRDPSLPILVYPSLPCSPLSAPCPSAKPPSPPSLSCLLPTLCLSAPIPTPHHRSSRTPFPLPKPNDFHFWTLHLRTSVTWAPWPSMPLSHLLRTHYPSQPPPVSVLPTHPLPFSVPHPPR